jgi:hypothetical protein
MPYDRYTMNTVMIDCDTCGSKFRYDCPVKIKYPQAGGYRWTPKPLCPSCRYARSRFTFASSAEEGRDKIDGLKLTHKRCKFCPSYAKCITLGAV